MTRRKRERERKKEINSPAIALEWAIQSLERLSPFDQYHYNWGIMSSVELVPS
jgi:hypothetical protein